MAVWLLYDTIHLVEKYRGLPAHVCEKIKCTIVINYTY